MDQLASIYFDSNGNIILCEKNEIQEKASLVIAHFLKNKFPNKYHELWQRMKDNGVPYFDRFCRNENLVYWPKLKLLKVSKIKFDGFNQQVLNFY